MAEQASTTTPFANRSILLCVGPGGVGKTTSAAALALAAARSGRTVAVVTIDPSLRLAQALGVDQALAEAGALTTVWKAEDGGPGRLDALLLDAKSVFDSIVESCAKTPQQARELLRNEIYIATSERLGGAIEYAAMARLQLLYAEGKHDLIVLDTPPTANAIDFLEAPQRIREFIDNPASKVLLGTAGIGARLLGLGASVFLRALARIGGNEFVRDLGVFLRDFADVVAEFTRRGGSFEDLLKTQKAGAILTTAATEFSTREAIEFLKVLRDQGINIEGVVLNRVDPPLPVPPDRDEVRAGLREYVGDEAAEDPELVDHIIDAYLGVRAQGSRAERSRAALTEAFPGLHVWTALRRSPPPERLDALVALGDELFRS